MDERLESAWALIAKDGLIQPDDTVIAAVSGGGDSVGLLLFLSENREALGISRLVGAHVNHGLRAEAKAEEMFVRALCEKLGIPLLVKQLFPQSSDMSEEWARKERYAFLKSAAEALNAKIAVAHTKDDQAETVLFHILRGTFVHGAAGMKSSNGVVIRPFLQTARGCSPLSGIEVPAHLPIHHGVSRSMCQADPGVLCGLQTGWATISALLRLPSPKSNLSGYIPAWQAESGSYYNSLEYFHILYLIVCRWLHLPKHKSVPGFLCTLWYRYCCSVS